MLVLRTPAGARPSVGHRLSGTRPGPWTRLALAHSYIISSLEQKNQRTGKSALDASTPEGRRITTIIIITTTTTTQWPGGGASQHGAGTVRLASQFFEGLLTMSC